MVHFVRHATYKAPASRARIGENKHSPTVACLSSKARTSLWRCTGITAEGASPPPSIRMVKLYDEAEARSGVAAAEAEILRAAQWRQSRGRRATLLALAVAVVAGLLLLARRRRVAGAGQKW